jgi:hypothetical protein
MDVFIALLTPNFRNSKWTDQEVGFAVSRGVLIIHVRDGLDPYGFIGETQSLSLSIENPENMADEMLLILMRNAGLKARTKECLMKNLETVGSFTFACKLMKLLERSGSITNSEIRRIRSAADSNNWVKEAYTVQAFLAAHPELNDAEAGV